MCCIRGLCLPILLFHIHVAKSNQVKWTRAEILENVLRNYSSKIAPNFNQGAIACFQFMNTTFPLPIENYHLSSPARGYQTYLSNHILYPSLFYCKPELLLNEMPTNVTVQLHINSFDSVSEMNMDFSIHMLITQTWVDERLKFEEPLGKIPFLELDTKNMHDVWVPDLYFVNEKRAAFHEVTVPNKLMHIYENGTIQYSARVTMTATCSMQLQKFPMDTQICSLYIKSFTYTIENVLLRWKKTNPVTLDPEFELPQFQLKRDVELYDCTDRTPDDYTCLEVKFELKRHLGYYVIQIYVPCVMIVMLSWVSFWLNIDSVPARISLGILTVLTMTTQNDSTQGTLPKVSYIKAIDVWNFLCLVFVFAALLEYSFVNYLSRKQIKLKQYTGDNHTTDTDDEDDVQPCPCYFRKKYHIGSMRKSRQNHTSVYVPDEIARKKAVSIDNFCRWFFPGVFFFLFTVYWCFFMFWEGTSSRRPDY